MILTLLKLYVAAELAKLHSSPNCAFLCW